MEHPDLTVSIFMEHSIGLQRVKRDLFTFYRKPALGFSVLDNRNSKMK